MSFFLSVFLSMPLVTRNGFGIGTGINSRLRTQGDEPVTKAALGQTEGHSPTGGHPPIAVT
jgi:hypothetical protein